MASEHFLPSTFVFSTEYAPVIKNFPMLAALAEACLWPVVLLLFDDQFVPRLSNLYRRRSASDRAKPPQGLHGKFRPYNGSLQDTRRPPTSNNSGNGGGEAVRFPITNGSLFASLDGRVPALHNYRRGVRTLSGLLVPPPPHFIHTSTDPSAGFGCCDDDSHHHQQQQHHHHHHLHPRSLRFANMVTASAAMTSAAAAAGDPAAKGCDHAEDAVTATPTDSLDDPTIAGRQNTDDDGRLPQNLQQLREKLYAQDDDDDDDDDRSCCDDDRGQAASRSASATVADSSDDDCAVDDDDDGNGNEDEEGEYATLSARSVCSATTAANDDFEYFAAATTEAPAEPPASGRVAYQQQRAPTRRSRHHQQQQIQHHHRHFDHHQHRHHHQQQRRGHARSAPLPPPPPLPPTPPTPRRARPRLTAVLSVDSLVTAAAGRPRSASAFRGPAHHHQPHHHVGAVAAGRHRGFGGIAGRRLGGARGHHGGSVPDLKRVFITDFL